MGVPLRDGRAINRQQSLRTPLDPLFRRLHARRVGHTGSGGNARRSHRSEQPANPIRTPWKSHPATWTIKPPMTDAAARTAASEKMVRPTSTSGAAPSSHASPKCANSICRPKNGWPWGLAMGRPQSPPRQKNPPSSEGKALRPSPGHSTAATPAGWCQTFAEGVCVLSRPQSHQKQGRGSHSRSRR